MNKVSKALTAATATILGSSAAIMKAKKICPICEVKKVVNKTKISQKAQGEYGNGICLTPPMGWSSWNLFRSKINEDLIKEIAVSMKNSGLVEAGYNYLNIDDCWQASERDELGRLQYDKVDFKNGIKNLSQFVNEQGMKLGIYSSNGTLTCEDYPASLRHEAIDADTFASWGVEYLKYDYCHNEKIPSKAPLINAINFSYNDDKAEVFASYKPSDLALSGDAKIVNCEGIDNEEYLVGLCSNLGKASFEVNVDTTGKYVMTITIRKKGNYEKFLMISINSEKEYHVYAPSTKSWSKEGKIQITVELNAGTNTIVLSNPVGSKMDSSALQYKLMGKELKRATKQYAQKNGVEEKKIAYSICEWGLNLPWKWASEAGNLWRTTPDIKAFWASVIGIYEVNVRLYKHASKGAWNDPDMLEVGNGNLTFNENRAHFSLWCMMCAPLILGNDVRSFIKPDGSVDTDNKVYQILTNKAMIAINQDEIGIQCRRIKAGKVDVLVKPLSNAKVAICVFNKSNSSINKEIDLEKIANLGFVNLPQKKNYNVYDVWEDEQISDVTQIDAAVDTHAVKVYIVE